MDKMFSRLHKSWISNTDTQSLKLRMQNTCTKHQYT